MKPTPEISGIIQHIDLEHRHLASRLVETQSAIQKLEASPTSEEAWLQALCAVETLRAEMLHHFECEENGGILEEAECQCPTVSGETTFIRNEHEQLRQAISNLEEILQSRRSSKSEGATQHIDEDAKRAEASAAAAKLFYELFHAIKMHENLENRVIGKAFGVSLVEEGEPSA